MNIAIRSDCFVYVREKMSYTAVCVVFGCFFFVCVRSKLLTDEGGRVF